MASRKMQLPSLVSPRAWFTRGDLDGFFGLFIDNLLQLMLLFFLCRAACGFTAEFLSSTVLPGAALSILIGNLFYARQARNLALRTGRRDVTALPYGINTPSLVAYVLLVMAPVYRETGDPRLAWQAGLLACLLSGVLELAGAFVGDWLRRHTPRAALLSALAGVAVTFIAMGFIFQMFASPLVALLPMLLILTSYAGKVRWPLNLPGGLLAILVGTALAWGLRAAGVDAFTPAAEPVTLSFHPPKPVPGDLFALLFDERGWRFLSVVFPMGLFNVVGSLQNLESAEAAGDRYPTRPSLLANGAGTAAAAFFGSPFPTTIYIGHPGWKAMGAGFGYSVLNGLVVSLLCLTGGFLLVLKVVPLEVTLGILLWIAVIITAQAFQETPKSHALAVALGLVPALAAWALYLVETTLRAAGATLSETFEKFGTDLYVEGMAALSQGFLVSAMVFAAVLAHVLERRFAAAAAWLLAAAGLSFTGVIHAYEIGEGGVRGVHGVGAAPEFGAAYLAAAAVLWSLARRGRLRNT